MGRAHLERTAPFLLDRTRIATPPPPSYAEAALGHAQLPFGDVSRELPEEPEAGTHLGAVVQFLRVILRAPLHSDGRRRGVVRSSATCGV
jgi:hypothetical protein